ncbi:MAG: hypothetical protein ACREDH_08770, partial [Methylocella sp.]
LRQDFVLHLTKLKFTVWNVNENSFTGSWACVDSVFTVPLSVLDTSPVTNVSNFDFSTLRTDNARYQVKGVASTQCPGPPASEPAGLLGVATASLVLGSDSGEDQEVGSTTQGAGLLAGFVLWDPASTVGGAKKHHHAN